MSDDDGSLNRRAFQRAMGSVGIASLAGCLGRLGVVGDDPVAFSERSTDIGFEYEGQEAGIGFGNSGTYVADYDRDGFPELLAVGGDRPILFDNDGGQLRPSGQLDGAIDGDVTIQSALFFDRDSNGWEDLLLLPKHGQPLFFANRSGTFERASVGLTAELVVPTAAAVADATGNGFLDLFIAQMGDWADGVPAGWLHDPGEPLETDNGAPNLLFHNDGETFERVEDAGIADTRWSLATSFVDLSGDGVPDIHVANDFNRDVLYRNQGDGTFRMEELPAETDRNGMSSLVTDVTGSGPPDLFVTNIYFPLEEADLGEEERDRLRRQFEFVLQSPRIEGNNLLINDGEGGFTDQAGAYGVAEGGWGWAALACDFDHDGHEELFHTTQNVFQIHDEPVYTLPMYFARTGDERFERQDAAVLGFGEANDRSTAMLDLDGSGSMDVVVGAYTGPYRWYRNEVDRLHPDRHWLQVDVRTATDAIAIGSVVTVTAGDRDHRRFLTSMSDYQSQSSRLLQFGLGEADRIDRLTVQWPDGSETSHSDLAVDRRVRVTPHDLDSIDLS